jgi:hypothetical protein
MAFAANRCAELQGGFVIVRDGKVLAELALPIAGLMTHEAPESVARKSNATASPINSSLYRPSPDTPLPADLHEPDVRSVEVFADRPRSVQCRDQEKMPVVF